MKNNAIIKANDLATKESKEHAIESGLSEIYHDESGKLIDVKKLIIRKKRSWVFWALCAGLSIIVISAIAWGVKHFMKVGIQADALEFVLMSDKQPIAGEEFFVMVNFKNNNPINLDNVEIHLTYPEGFVFLDSQPLADDSNNTWSVGALPSQAFSQIKIKGKLITPLNQRAVIIGELRYKTEGFSAEYKKTASFDLSITDLGVDFSLIHPDTVMVGEKQKLVVKYRARHSYLDNFRLQINPNNASNIEFVTDIQSDPNIELVKPWVWQVNELGEEERELVVYYKVLDKLTEKQRFDLSFKYRLSASKSVDMNAIASTSPAELGGILGSLEVSSSSIEISKPTETFYNLTDLFFEQEVIKNDLNLLLIINGSDKDQEVDFGQTMQYSISYANKGETALDNVVITVVVDSDLIDWSSFKDSHHGLVKGNIISWSKDQIPALGQLTKGSNGTIDFNLKIKEVGKNLKSDQIKSYAQFQVQSAGDLESLLKVIKEREAEADQADGNETIKKQDQPASLSLLENKSNVIINKVNSDFDVKQTLRYFNEDNVPVGAGPLPLEVDKDTSLRVYWQLENSLHDLEKIRVSVKLPDYVSWQEKSSLSTGSIRWDESSRQVIWELQSLSRAMGSATAEFSINVRPKTEQRNQIIIILPKVEASATDLTTKGQVSRGSKVKTSKLEDDDIIRTVNLDMADGLVK